MAEDRILSLGPLPCAVVKEYILAMLHLLNVYPEHVITQTEDGKTFAVLILKTIDDAKECMTRLNGTLIPAYEPPTHFNLLFGVTGFTRKRGEYVLQVTNLCLEVTCEMLTELLSSYSSISSINLCEVTNGIVKSVKAFVRFNEEIECCIAYHKLHGSTFCGQEMSVDLIGVKHDDQQEIKTSSSSDNKPKQSKQKTTSERPAKPPRPSKKSLTPLEHYYLSLKAQQDAYRIVFGIPFQQDPSAVEKCDSREQDEPHHFTDTNIRRQNEDFVEQEMRVRDLSDDIWINPEPFMMEDDIL